MEQPIKDRPEESSEFLGTGWFDPIEAAIRDRVRGFIEDLMDAELAKALGRSRYRRPVTAEMVGAHAGLSSDGPELIERRQIKRPMARDAAFFGVKMGRLLEIVTPLHTATKRDYMARMNDDKVICSLKAREYEADYWDGDRRFGYGGYRFIEGRWAPVARALISTYGLKDGSSVLDVGCGKGFLLYEMLKILPGLKIAGFDVSHHGLANAHDQVKPYLFNYRAQDAYPYGDDQFDLVISLGTLHNLRLFEIDTAVSEIERVGKNKYIMVEGYRNISEMHNLECWALTAESILHTSEWIWLYNRFGYTGDYEFIYFE